MNKMIIAFMVLLSACETKKISVFCKLGESVLLKESCQEIGYSSGQVTILCENEEIYQLPIANCFFKRDK